MEGSSAPLIVLLGGPAPLILLFGGLGPPSPPATPPVCVDL